MEDVDAAEDLIVKQHRKEKKDLQAKIQCMKNAVPKNDKKRRKQLVEEIAKLEADLNQKHEQELKQLMNISGENKVDLAANGLQTLDLESEEQSDAKHGRVSKAQKRRDKKAALEKERESRIAEAEIENLSGSRHLEQQKLSQMLAARQLQIKQIPSDGHCLYRAVEDQLKERVGPVSLAELRTQTAQYMRGHPDDFLPFLTNASTGDMYTADEFERYCSEVANTAAWGGQLELRALTHVLQTPIEVIQADSPTIIVGEEYKKDTVTLVYMRHAFGLGEHYNSVEALKEPVNEEDV
ncbi:OTU6B Deubiquitinase, partial [Amia calva]|nr:OTU6B Deubiquitinase [Amia calva]